MHYALLKKEDIYFFLARDSQKYFVKKKKFKISYLETNGLDLQTILGSKDKSQIKNILDIQEILDSNMMSDHFRVFLKKINQKLDFYKFFLIHLNYLNKNYLNFLFYFFYQLLNIFSLNF